MISKLVPSVVIGAFFALFAATAVAQNQSPNPAGVINDVAINGDIVPSVEHEFFPDNSWAMWKDDVLVGWGYYSWDSVLDTIEYVNMSGDGGGGQMGTFTWRNGDSEWERTWTSNPTAPQMSLIPSV